MPNFDTPTNSSKQTNNERYVERIYELEFVESKIQCTCSESKLLPGGVGAGVAKEKIMFVIRQASLLKTNYRVNFFKIVEVCTSQKLPDFWLLGQPGNTRCSPHARESCKVRPSLRIFNVYLIMQGKHAHFLTNIEKITIPLSFNLYPVFWFVT